MVVAHGNSDPGLPTEQRLELVFESCVALLVGQIADRRDSRQTDRVHPTEQAVCELTIRIYAGRASLHQYAGQISIRQLVAVLQGQIVGNQSMARPIVNSEQRHEFAYRHVHEG